MCFTLKGTSGVLGAREGMHMCKRDVYMMCVFVSAWVHRAHHSISQLRPHLWGNIIGTVSELYLFALLSEQHQCSIYGVFCRSCLFSKDMTWMDTGATSFPLVFPLLSLGQIYSMPFLVLLWWTFVWEVNSFVWWWLVAVGTVVRQNNHLQ